MPILCSIGEKPFKKKLARFKQRQRGCGECAMRASLIALAACFLAACSQEREPPATPVSYTRILPMRDGRVILGKDALFEGVPGSGKTIDEIGITRWLEVESHHESLSFALPWHWEGLEDQVYVPDDNSLTLAKIELGRQLFFDPRMTGPGGMTCAECHHPTHGYARSMLLPTINRKPLPAVNRIFSREQFWDGKASELEQQPRIPISRAHEMNSSPEQTTKQIASVPGYRLQFERIYGEVSYNAIVKSLACFERALLTGPAPYDYQRVLDRFADRDLDSLTQREREIYDLALAGAKQNPMSEAAKRGQILFFSDRTNCSDCHSGLLFTDGEYHNVGTGSEIDAGRFNVTGKEEDRGAFRTPSLRNVSQLGPYMHDANFYTLLEAVGWFNAGGDSSKGQSDLIRPLGLNAEELNDLVAFLEALTCQLPAVEMERLPK